MSNFELHELILCCGPFFFFFSPVPCLFHEWIQTAGKKELRGHAVLFLIAGWQFFFFFFWHLVLLTVCYWRVILSELGNRGSSVLPFSEAAEIREAALAWFSTASTLTSDRCSTSDTPAQCLLISRLHRVECSNVTLKGFFFKEDSELNQKKNNNTTLEFRHCCKAVVDYSLTELQKHPREGGVRTTDWKTFRSVVSCVLPLRNFSLRFCYAVSIGFKFHAVPTREEKHLQWRQASAVPGVTAECLAHRKQVTEFDAGNI